jgi:hypothetical protein
MNGSDEHINGELGEVACYDSSTQEYGIRLEDDLTQTQLKIKPQNVYVVLELPSKK